MQTRANYEENGNFDPVRFRIHVELTSRLVFSFVVPIVGVDYSAKMASDPVYRIVNSGPRSMMAVAVRDLMPGEMVLTENEPALFFTQADRMNFQFPVDPLIEIVFAAYDAFVLATSSHNNKNC